MSEKRGTVWSQGVEALRAGARPEHHVSILKPYLHHIICWSKTLPWVPIEHVQDLVKQSGFKPHSAHLLAMQLVSLPGK